MSQCITDATRQAIPGDQLQKMYVTSAIALGATDDPTYQQYQAVMDAYGEDIDVDNNVPMSGYTVIAALATALGGITGDITPQSVAAAIKAMPDEALPGGGGVTPCPPPRSGIYSSASPSAPSQAHARTPTLRRQR